MRTSELKKKRFIPPSHGGEGSSVISLGEFKMDTLRDVQEKICSPEVLSNEENGNFF